MDFAREEFVYIATEAKGRAANKTFEAAASIVLEDSEGFEKRSVERQP